MHEVIYANTGPAEAIYSWSGKIYLDIMNVTAREARREILRF